MSYFEHGKTADVSLFLQLIDPFTQLGKTGASPQVQVRRIRDSATGAALDGWYWNGTTFTSTPTWLAMSEYDATNSPGLYFYFFEQSLASANMVCAAYMRNAASPPGFAVEEHRFSDEIRIWASTPAVPVVGGDTVMGRLAAMESSTGAVALANADATWDEQLSGHTTAGSAGKALADIAAGRTGARQIDITVEDQLAAPIQGVQIDIYDAANTVFLARYHTDINGEVSLALDDGTYYLRFWRSGYSFTTPQALVVTADATPTYQGTSLITVTTPSAPNLCVVFGYVYDAAGVPVAGSCVSATAIVPQAVGGAQSGERVVHTATDTLGYFEIELVRTSQVRFKIEGTDVDSTKTVPDAASQDFTTWT